MGGKMIEKVLSHIDQNMNNATERLFDLLKIASISTDTAYQSECEKAALWLVQDLQKIGFEAQIHPTTGHPMVVAQYRKDTNAPHVLFYGHYDVQPVDPLELWHSPPFEPELQDGELGPVIRARGAADDKGQLMTFIEACRAYKAIYGGLPCNITVFIEGEEESGSPSLVPFMKQNADLLRADVALICDTGLLGDNTPAIVTQLRGMLGEELTITGPKIDLHSGMYGGVAMNPARVLARIIASLHDDQGRVTIPEFYDGVPELKADVRADWQALDFNATDFLDAVGLSEPAGEQDKTPLEMIWSRPTCEINGIESGYTGRGFKTVLPSKARAKISFRLVGAQDPLKIRHNFRQMVTQMLPKDCTVTFEGHGASKASKMQTSHPVFNAARAALSQEWPQAAAFVGCGGSIPIAGHFQSILGMDSVLVGFSRDDDAIHSPNEKYDLRSFQKGIRSWARVLNAINTPLMKDTK